jgi:hypothetical protein
MPISQTFKNSRLFLHLGFGLIFLTVVTLPIKVQVNVQTSEFPDYEGFNIGLLLAPVIGSYGLASLALGIAESSASKQGIWLYFLPVFILIYIGLAIAVSILYYPVNRENWSWWIYLGLILIPIIITHVVVLLHFTNKEKVTKILENSRIRVPTFIILVAVPLLFVGLMLFQLTIK